ncbi:hypothetical protein [Pseudokordiimonas caeni]|uniref:hypothetical protein n=1 Tax=Pseudokordiimonas caeni TaxID=2997908 RepID=UPI0028127AEC|nr:hypothetical protein [Pseudokordiimonas caeni]
MTILLSRLVVAAAFVGGAFIAVIDPAAIDWKTFLPVIAAGFVGLVVLKVSTGAAARADSVLIANRRILNDSLHAIVLNLEELNGRRDKIPTYEMRFEIDRLFRDDLFAFADARDSLKHIFGLSAYAEIMSSFAAGERYLNRVWSASTDGYVDEVLVYIEKALGQFVEAVDAFDRADTAARKETHK